MLLASKLGEWDGETDLVNTFDSLVTTDADHSRDPLNDEEDTIHGKP